MANSLPMPMQRIELYRISLICIVLYLGSAAVAIFLSRQPGSIATLWYSNAVIVVACMHRSQRDCYVLLLLGALSNLFINRYFGSSWTLSTIFMVVNGLEMFFSVSLLARYCHLERSITSPKELIKTLIAGGLIPTFLCGLLAAYSLLQYGVVSSFSKTFFLWFEGSLVGAVSVLPIGMHVGLIGWKSYFNKLWRPHILAALLLILTLTPIPASSLSFPYVYMVSLMILLAFKGGFAGATLGVFLCSVEVTVLIASGIFPAPPPINFYYEALFYIPLLLTLVLPLLIASGLEKVNEANFSLTLERERFRRLYEDTPAMMASVTTQGEIVHVSKLLLQHLGYSQEDVCGHDVTEFFSPESRKLGMTKILPAFLRDGVVSDVDLQLYRHNGEVIDVAMSAVWEYHNGNALKRVLMVLRDVTEERRLATKMAYLAQHDALTGLPNRVLFQDRVTHFCALARREKKCFGLMFLDLDHFKEVNDTFGHGFGDALLQLVAERLRSTVRGADTISRIGGDEFVILISAVGTPHDASEVAEKILHEVAGPCVINGQAQMISLSIGIALFSQDGDDHDSLLRNADAAMYQAKRSGHNRYCFFQNVQPAPELPGDSRKELRL